jgi:hypothetical protein
MVLPKLRHAIEIVQGTAYLIGTATLIGQGVAGVYSTTEGLCAIWNRVSMPLTCCINRLLRRWCLPNYIWPCINGLIASWNYLSTCWRYWCDARSWTS